MKFTVKSVNQVPSSLQPPTWVVATQCMCCMKLPLLFLQLPKPCRFQPQTRSAPSTLYFRWYKLYSWGTAEGMSFRTVCLCCTGNSVFWAFSFISKLLTIEWWYITKNTQIYEVVIDVKCWLTLFRAPYCNSRENSFSNFVLTHFPDSYIYNLGFLSFPWHMHM